MARVITRRKKKFSVWSNRTENPEYVKFIHEKSVSPCVDPSIHLEGNKTFREWIPNVYVCVDVRSEYRGYFKTKFRIDLLIRASKLYDVKYLCIS